MNLKVNVFALVFIAFSSSLMAQQEERTANNNFKAGNYAVALKFYQKLLEKDTSNQEYKYRLGVSQIHTNNNPAEALAYFKDVEKERKTDSDFLFMLGKAYLYNHDFVSAKASFENCKKLAEKNEDLKSSADVWYKMTETAERMIKSPLDVSFINMGKYINSEMDELTPFVTPDNEILLYTSNEKYDNQFFIYTNNVYYSYTDGDIFRKGRALSAVNSMDDEFMAGISLSNERIFVQLQGFEGFQDLISSDRKNKGYQGKTMLSANVNSVYAEFGACETVDGDTLFFSSGREGGYGGMDIYYSLKLPTGEWGAPRNVGDKINSPYDEDFPVLSIDGSKMYFASNRPESMGGFDIFEAKILSSGEYETPKNIGYPLNDVYDNKTIAFSDNERYAYVSAIKPDGFGYADLYRVVFNQMDPAVKILVLNFKNSDATASYAASDTTLKITAYQKGKVVFGEYAYDVKNSLATIALPPGSYSIEIIGETTEEYIYKVTVPDTPSGDKIEKLDILLKAKN